MTDIIAALRASLPARAIIADSADLTPFQTDWRRIHSHAAICAVLPETTEQVAAIVNICAARDVKIVPQGGNTGLVAGGVPIAGPPQVVVSLRRMAKILALDEIGDTITVQAGATLQSVQDAAAGCKRLFPVSYAAEGTAQLGGIISTNAGGIQVLAYGSTRAQVLGLEVVLPDGRIWNGLRALRKDNTGFDLKQLFIGGEGTLGIITAATLKLWPAVSGRATALVGVATLPDALTVFAALRAHAGARLTICEFMTRAAYDLGVAHLPGARLPFPAAAYLLVELSGHGDDNVDGVLESALAPLLEAGAAIDAVIAQSGRERADLIKLREAIPDGELAEGGAVKHDISVPIGKIPDAVAAIEALVQANFPDCRLNIFGHVGDGNLHVNVRPAAGRTLADLADRKTAITEAVEAVAVRLGGSFSAEHGIGQMRIPGMAAHKSAVELDLMRRLKAALDPANLLNPGKMLP
jgi:FAD/FMN-containing dehydrogenase